MKPTLLILAVIYSVQAFGVDYDQALEFLNASTTIVCAPGDNQPLCDNPTSMCKNRPKDTFETDKYAIRKASAPTVQGDAFEKPYEDVLNKVKGSEAKLAKLIASAENQVFKKFGKTNQQVKEVIEKFKVSLTQQAAKDFPPELAKKMGKKLADLKFNNAQTLLTTPEKVESFTQMCGADGLVKNAFYDGVTNSLTICPGFLLNSLLTSKGELNNLSMVIGHELGHSLHQPDFTGGNYFKTPDHFDKFMKCMSDNYISDKNQKFGTNKQTVEQLEKNGIPNLKAEIEKVSKKKPVDVNYLGDLKRSLGTADHQVEKFKYFASLPDQRLSQKCELLADYESSATVRDQLQLLPKAQRATRLKEMVGMYCDNFTPNEKKVMALKWNGVNPGSHPPETFRLENYFRNPEIRHLLGCSPLEASDKPWCSTEGAVRK